MKKRIEKGLLPKEVLQTVFFKKNNFFFKKKDELSWNCWKNEIKENENIFQNKTKHYFVKF